MTDKIKLLVLFLLLVQTSLIAQQADSSQTMKHQMGINTIYIFYQLFPNRGAYEALPINFPLDIQYKLVSKKSAWRVGMSLAIEDRTTKDSSPVGNVTKNEYQEVYISLGKEWLRSLHKKWQFSFGSDIVPFVSHTFYKNASLNNFIYTNEITSKGIGLRAFMGFRYNISSRLYITSEASLFSRYSKDVTKRSNQTGDNPLTHDDSSGYNFSIKVNPAAGLYLFYCF